MSWLRSLQGVFATTFLICVAFAIVAPLIHPLVPVLQDGWVIVTGCTPGSLGFTLVKDILSQQPPSVKVLCTVRKEDHAQELKKAYGSSRLKVNILDVTDKTAMQNLANEMKSEKVIALVNNAGISGHSSVEVSWTLTLPALISNDSLR